MLRNLPEEKAIQLLDKYKIAASIDTQVEQLEQKLEGEEVISMSILAETKAHVQELKDVIKSSELTFESLKK